jgi:hypothetical protein
MTGVPARVRAVGDLGLRRSPPAPGVVAPEYALKRLMDEVQDHKRPLSSVLLHGPVVAVVCLMQLDNWLQLGGLEGRLKTAIEI